MEKRQETEVDLSHRLPDAVLANVLRLAAPRDLAVSRCVCRSWRALVDDRRLLSADLFPRSLAGIFIDYSDLPYSHFLARPSSSSSSSTNRYQLPCTNVVDHCNGLVLTREGVLNPATGGWTPFPSPPPPPRVPGTHRFLDDLYLAFDPATDPSHYQVFVIPIVPPPWHLRRPRPTDDHNLDNNDDDGATTANDEEEEEEYPCGGEWPPSPYTVSVFSSRTGQWGDRSFVREKEEDGAAAGTTTVTAAGAEDKHRAKGKRKAVCWRGALYVHCQMDLIVRIPLSSDDHTYRVIRPPMRAVTLSGYYQALHLGKSEKGVYAAVLEGRDDHRLRVWHLLDGGGGGDQQACRWVLKHDSGRGLAVPSIGIDQPACYGSWILDNGYDYYDDDDDNHGGSSSNSDDAQQQDQKMGWNSDDDGVEEGESAAIDEDMRNTAGDVEHRYVRMQILGFHPFREVVFLHRSWTRGLAYHLNTSKLEDLGNVCPQEQENKHTLICGEFGYITGAFPYTPCFMGDFSQQYSDWSDDDDYIVYTST